MGRIGHDSSASENCMQSQMTLSFALCMNCKSLPNGRRNMTAVLRGGAINAQEVGRRTSRTKVVGEYEIVV
jgi:hypothetical protein